MPSKPVKSRRKPPAEFSAFGGPSSQDFAQVGVINPARLTYKPFKPRTETQAQALETLRRHSLVFLIGPAGSAKTFLGAALAMEKLQKGEIETIVAARPAIEAGDSIGFLKGDMAEKLGPYVRPMIDCLSHFVGAPSVKALQGQGTVEVTSMSYLRGRTLQNAVVILDEMQNATPAQLKLALTRLGEGTTCVVTMDPTQCDLPDFEDSAYHDLWRFANKPDIAIVEFDLKDVVRSKLVKTVLQAYNE